MTTTNVRALLRGFVAAAALALFALPATAAPTKQFSFDISPSVPAGGGLVTATLTNQTPSGGNSAINSFIIKKPGNATLSGPFSPIPGATFTIAANGDLKVNGFSGLLRIRIIRKVISGS